MLKKWSSADLRPRRPGPHPAGCINPSSFLMPQFLMIFFCCCVVLVKVFFQPQPSHDAGLGTNKWHAGDAFFRRQGGGRGKRTRRRGARGECVFHTLPVFQFGGACAHAPADGLLAHNIFLFFHTQVASEVKDTSAPWGLLSRHFFFLMSTMHHTQHTRAAQSRRCALFFFF